MSLARVLGALLIVTALILLVMAFQRTESVIGELHKLFTGDFRDGVTWLILGCMISGLLGVVAITRPHRRFVGVE